MTQNVNKNQIRENFRTDVLSLNRYRNYCQRFEETKETTYP